MLRPNLHCTITKAGETYDGYGRPVLGKTVRSLCSVVKLMNSAEKTSVRADSSASRGSAAEITADARLLFSPLTNITVGDKVIVAGFELRVMNVAPRFDVHSRLDHYQVDANVWA
jgi:hypothetical protein